MKSTGIIAEFNPFHNGHLYHMEQSRERTGSDYLIIIISGDFTQRGLPAVYRKYMRVRSALLSGADLVLEMPVFGSVAPAADFADCGVSMLTASGAADVLSFGSECGNLQALEHQAALLSSETESQSQAVKAALRSGMSWPKARAMAYESLGGISGLPNDILGIEYLRALKKYSSSMTALTVSRTDPGYHSAQRNGSFASAYAIRRAIAADDQEFLQAVLPPSHFTSLKEEPCPAVSADDFSLLYHHRLLAMTKEDLAQTASMPADLANKLDGERLTFGRTTELIGRVKDRQYTYTRVSRCLTNAMLGITKEDQEFFKELNSAPWLRILGFRKSASPLLSKMKKQSSVPIITKTADARNLLSKTSLRLFEKHLQASEVYRLICEAKTGQSMKNEYTRSPIIL